MSIDDIYESYIAIYDYDEGCFCNKQDNDLEKDFRVINEFYYDSFGIRLNIEDENSRAKLFKFANDCFRYKLLNDLMSISVKMMINHGDYIEEELYKRLDTVLEIVESNTKLLAHFHDVKPIKLTPMSHEETDRHFRDFLQYVDPSNDYLNIYEDMLKNKRIVFVDELTKEEKEKIMKKTPLTDTFNKFFYVDKNGVGKIYLERNGTVDDLPALAHEFAHYVSYEKAKDKGHDPSIVVNEFPSTFYEMVAIKYLANLGVPKEELVNLNALRFGFIYNSGIDLSLLNGYLKLFLQNKFSITREDDIRLRKETIADFIEANGPEAYSEVIKNYPEFKDPEYMAEQYCDAANASLYNNRQAYTMLYQYVLGNHFAVENVKRLDSDVLAYMKQVTCNLSGVNIGNLIDKNRIKNKSKRKKRDE